MTFKKVKPRSPGARHQIRPKKKIEIQKISKIKSLIKGNKNSSGRNNKGIITVRHKGNGVKRKYRKIDFNSKIAENSSNFYVVCSIEHDPYRNSFIASLFDLNKKKIFLRYCL